MKLIESLKKLESSSEFKDWKDKEHYLCHAFVMEADNFSRDWQFGYYSPKTDKITTFIVSDKIQKTPETEVFKEKGTVNMLDISKTKITYDKAIEIAENKREKEYNGHRATKTIGILQHIDLGLVWNITFLTNTFKTLNIKIDAGSGKVLHHELVEFFKFE